MNRVLAGMQKPNNLTVNIGGAVSDMHDSFKSFGLGLILAVVLVYLILMAQFASFSDPFIILLAIPPGFSGVVLFLLITGTTLNIMSLMGVIMMAGIAVSDSILIVEFVGALRVQGHTIKAALSRGLQSPSQAHSHDNSGHSPRPHSHGVWRLNQAANSMLRLQEPFSAASQSQAL